MHGEHDWPEASDLMFYRHRAPVPWRRRSRSAIIVQHQALALAVLERQRQPAVDLRDIAGGYAGRLQAVAPEQQGLFAGDAQSRARNAVGAAPLGRGRKIEEG